MTATITARAAGAVLCLLGTMSLGAAQPAEPATPPAENEPAFDPAAFAAKIESEVAEIRGLPFKRPVGVETQTPSDFGAYVDREISEEVPEQQARYYDRIVRKLGLYRGPEITDFRGAMKSVLTSQAAAYYDPKTQRFYVLYSDLPEMMEGALYAHELYHGLQDQYFELDKYLATVAKRGAPAFNGDHTLARQAVVEGEATYIMSMWTMKRMTQSIPPRELIAAIVAIQSNLSIDQLRTMIDQPQIAAQLGDKVQESIQAAKDIPPFILETMMGSYLKGLGFVFAVQEQGWPAVEKLYREYPPQSTEQILHPEKWVSRENPSTITWPRFGRAAALKDWELLDDDVLGELRWGIIFREHGLAADADAAATGWDGDRYAVFKRKNSDELLLLLRTAWDTEADAKEFADAYRRLLAVKYADAPQPTRLVQRGVDVYIVEGATESVADSLLKVVMDSRKQRARVVN